MRAGRLRHRIVLQSKTQAADAFGQLVDTWTDTATVWAFINPQSAREFLAQGIQAQQVSHVIEMRYQDNITPQMRIQYTDRTKTTRTFDIEQVLEPMIHGERLQLVCKELV